MELFKKNPSFKSMEKGFDEEYASEKATTVHGVFGKTLFLLGLAIVGAVLAIIFLYNLTEDNVGTFIALLLGSLVVALIAGLIANFSLTLCPVCSMIYSVAYGFALGTISLFVELYYPGVAICAVIATFATTLVMGVLYFTGIIKVNAKFKAFIITSLIAMFLTSLIAFILAKCGFAQMENLLYGDGIVGWIVSIFGVLIAALSLCIDFDYAANLADGEAPKKYEWKAAYCLTVGVIYLYIRLLDLFIRIAAASKK